MPIGISGFVGSLCTAFLIGAIFGALANDGEGFGSFVLIAVGALLLIAFGASAF